MLGRSDGHPAGLSARRVIVGPSCGHVPDGGDHTRQPQQIWYTRYTSLPQTGTALPCKAYLAGGFCGPCPRPLDPCGCRRRCGGRTIARPPYRRGIRIRGTAVPLRFLFFCPYLKGRKKRNYPQ